MNHSRLPTDPTRGALRRATDTPEAVAGQTPLPDQFASEPDRGSPEIGTVSVAYGHRGPRFRTDQTGGSYPQGSTALALADPPYEMEAPRADADLFTKTRDERLILLARKYAASTVSPELEGRFRILTERLARLCPRVSVAEVEQVERARAVAREATADLAAVRARFGLR